MSQQGEVVKVNEGVDDARLRRNSQAFQTPGDGVIKVGELVLSGSLITVNSNTTITTPQQTVLVDVLTSNATVTLPSLEVYAGAQVFIKKTATSGTGQIQVVTPGSETMDGENTEYIRRKAEALTMLCDGTTWNVTNRQYLTSKVDGAIITKSSETYQMVAGELICFGNSVGSATAFILPPAGDYIGLTVYAKKIDSTGFSTFLSRKAGSGETVDGGTQVILVNQYDYVGVISDGSDWHIVAQG